MSNFTKLLLTHEIFRILTCVFSILVKFDIHFLGLPCGIFFGLITDDQLHLKALKNLKKNAIFFKLFWYKFFGHWKSKLLIFLGDSILKPTHLSIVDSHRVAMAWRLLLSLI